MIDNILTINELDLNDENTELVRVSTKLTAANSGQYASRILKSLGEGKKVFMSFTNSHNEKNRVREKVMQIDAILARMLNETNYNNKSDWRIVRTLPSLCSLLEEIDEEGNKVFYNVCEFLIYMGD